MQAVNRSIALLAIGISGCALIIVSMFLSISSIGGWVSIFVGGAMLLIPLTNVMWKRYLILSSTIFAGAIFLLLLAILPLILHYD